MAGFRVLCVFFALVCACFRTQADLHSNAGDRTCDLGIVDDGTDATSHGAAVTSEHIESQKPKDTRGQENDHNHTISESKKNSEPCVDNNENCAQWAEIGECEKNPGFMLSDCRKSCASCGNNNLLDFGEQARSNDPKVKQVISRTIKYMNDEVMKNPKYSRIRQHCRNQDKQCSYWAATGECDANPGYMTVKCAPACQTCELLDFHNRCPLDPDAPSAFEPGEMNIMFERIVTSPEFAQYKLSVLSRPKDAVTLHSDENTNIGPWVVSFDDFLTDEECDRLIALGHEHAFERSYSVGKLQVDGKFGENRDHSRTSENTWCRDSCNDDIVARNVMQRISNVTSLPEENSEYLQLLKYEVGQYYRRHHDYIAFQNEQPCGVRVLTFFLYLNDVESGGGTKFTDLNGLIVKPKKGKAVLWPSVLDSDPKAIDERTYHEAMPVKQGVKYGANAWFHIHDFKSAYKKDCTG